MLSTSHQRQLFVKSLRSTATQGIVRVAGRSIPCALGRSGRRAIKREGDGATPAGAWRVLRVYYRPDRMRRPQTGLPTHRIYPDDGWCDAAMDRNYNRPVRQPYCASAERMWRDDELYDLLVVLDYNIAQRIRHRGSAIFLHVARPGFAPTEGCIALSKPDLIRLVAALRRGDRIHIAA